MIPPRYCARLGGVYARTWTDRSKRAPIYGPPQDASIGGKVLIGHDRLKICRANFKMKPVDYRPAADDRSSKIPVEGEHG